MLVGLALLTNGCASLTPPPGQESNLSYTPRGASGPTLADRPGEESPRALASPPPSLPESGWQSATLTRQAVFGIDFLQLADIVLRECPAYSAERLFMDMHRVQRLLEPTLWALASQDPDDKFCVRLEQAHHQAIHGGGNWRLGRTWPNEWNRMIMEALREAEVEAGRLLTRNEVLNIVASRMKRYDIPMKFIHGGRR